MIKFFMIASIFMSGILLIPEALQANMYYNTIFGIMQQSIEVDEDDKLPFRVRGISGGGHTANLTNITYALNDPTFGTIDPPPQTNPQNLDGFFVPSGKLGDVTLTATGRNKKGNLVSGSINISVLVGAAVTVEISTFEPVPK